MSKTYVYPVLGSRHDLGFVRISGHGLGNCFYSYFHSLVAAKKHDATLIHPPWFSIKPGTFLRGEYSKRTYFRMFKPNTGALSSVKKYLVLILNAFNRHHVRIEKGGDVLLKPGAVNCVGCSEFTFEGLHEHRSLLQESLLESLRTPIPAGHAWGGSDFIGIHVRLGDFKASSAESLKNGATNTRIPLLWYAKLIQSFRETFTDKRILIFSDGRAEELQPLLDLGATLHRAGSDIHDLITMASSFILVGSNSTFSKWAAFLGNMPTVWLKTGQKEEVCTGPEVPTVFIAFDDENPNIKPLVR